MALKYIKTSVDFLLVRHEEIWLEVLWDGVDVEGLSQEMRHLRRFVLWPRGLL